MSSERKKTDYHVEMIGHASLRVQYGGKTLLTDPWYFDPIDCNTQFHWPPLLHDVDELASETDAIYISHIHPDHLDPRTLERFSRKIPIYIGDYVLKGFKTRVEAMGFTVHECPFQTLVKVEGTEFEVAILESDYAESAAYDSSIVIKCPQYTLFDNNDCFLKEPKYHWVKDNFQVDYAFLGFSPASYYPASFEFEREEKARLLKESADRRYNDFLSVAALLKPRIAVPFAMGIRFFEQSMLSKNVMFNSPWEAGRRANKIGIRSEVMGPKDKILEDGTVVQGSYAKDEAGESAALYEHAMKLQPWVQEMWAAETPASPDIIPRFARHMTELWKKNMTAYPEVRDNVIAFRIDGPQGGSFYFDFSRNPDDIFVKGEPENFDMRYSYVDRMLQLRMDGIIDWDELHFSNRVSVCQRNYAAAFYAMIRTGDGAKLQRPS